MHELERKAIIVEPEVWSKVGAMGKEPGQQRPANHQAGVILKRYFQNRDAFTKTVYIDGELSVRGILKEMMDQVDEIIRGMELTPWNNDKIANLYEKKEKLEQAFNSVRGDLYET